MEYQQNKMVFLNFKRYLKYKLRTNVLLVVDHNNRNLHYTQKCSNVPVLECVWLCLTTLSTFCCPFYNTAMKYESDFFELTIWQQRQIFCCLTTKYGLGMYLDHLRISWINSTETFFLLCTSLFFPLPLHLKVS